MIQNFIIPNHLQERYADVYTPEVLIALADLFRFNQEIKELMQKHP